MVSQFELDCHVSYVYDDFKRLFSSCPHTGINCMQSCFNYSELFTSNTFIQNRLNPIQCTLLLLFCTALYSSGTLRRSDMCMVGCKYPAHLRIWLASKQHNMESKSSFNSGPRVMAPRSLLISSLLAVTQ